MAEEIPKVRLPEPQDFKLSEYYKAIQLTGLFVPFLFAALIYALPAWFEFLREPRLAALLLAAVFVLHMILYFLMERFRARFIYWLHRWIWVAFFIAFVYVTGGVRSQFLFLFLFPLMVAATDLDFDAVKHVGIALSAAFASFIFFTPAELWSPVLLTEHASLTVLFGVIVFYVYTVVKDTLRQKLEKEEAKKKYLELTEIDRVKTDFITVASHQMRTPLSAVRWGLEGALGDPDLSVSAKEILGNSLGSLQKAMDIVNELLKSAELDSKNVEFARAPVDLLALVKNILRDVSYLARGKDAAVALDAPVRLREVRGDREALESALANIVDNAIRYSPGGRVEIRLTDDPEKVVLTVKDTGIGIPPDDLGHIFERFYRGKNAVAFEANETGIGLYTSKRIIERHGGTIGLQSTLGAGTVVTVVLPAAKEETVSPLDKRKVPVKG